VPILTVEIDAGPDADATQLLRLTTQLRRQLLELDVEAVEVPAIDAPQGAKTVDQTVSGMLLVTPHPCAGPGDSRRQPSLARHVIGSECQGRTGRRRH